MNNENNKVIICKSLSHTYKDGNNEIPVLKDLNFQLSQGESVAIIGSSGAGKSTLLQLLGGLDAPTNGLVEILGHDISNLSANKRGKLRNKHLGFVYQFHHLLPEFSALENVMMPLLIAKLKKSLAKSNAIELLTKVGMDHRQAHRPGQLSGGERQRVAIARALVAEPACILADEPTGNLDEQTANQVLELLLELTTESNNSLIIVTHDLKLARKMNKTYELKGGKLILS